jgi:hypothetical protein
MLLVLQVIATFLVSIGWALALAHALELPGKRRLDKDSYIATQAIYYPGFTIGAAFGEPGAILATLALLIATGTGEAEFSLILAALVALLAMHAVYWILTHPVNKFWIHDQQMGGLGKGFFGVGRRGRELAKADPDEVWTTLRDRWEYSHVLRALLAGVALLCLIVAGAL